MKSKKTTKVRSSELIRRLRAPYLLFPDDLAVILRLPETQARSAARLGLLGPVLTVQGEPCLLRDDLEGHMRLVMSQRLIKDRELVPESAPAGDETVCAQSRTEAVQ